jgi:hypothetical protein
MQKRIASDVEWGMYWIKCAYHWPEWAMACQHNAHMEAMQIMAFEANW